MGSSIPHELATRWLELLEAATNKPCGTCLLRLIETSGGRGVCYVSLRGKPSVGVQWGLL